MENGKEIPAKLVQLRTQLVSQGHTRHLLAETDLMTLRIHCYSPGIGENALHSHTKEDHIFLVLEGTAQFNTGRDGKTVLKSRQAPGGSFACRLLLSVLQLGRHLSCNGTYRCRSGQIGHALESRWHGHSRKNSGTRSRKAGADRGGVF